MRFILYDDGGSICLLTVDIRDKYKMWAIITENATMVAIPPAAVLKLSLFRCLRLMFLPKESSDFILFAIFFENFINILNL